MSAERARAYRRGFPHGLMFHRLRSPHDVQWPQGALSPAELERILLFVGIDNIISPHEWMSRVESGRLAATDLCLTFDDGLRTQIEHALPVLERYHLQAFWFVYSCVFEGHPINSEIYSHIAGQSGGMASLIKEFLRRCPEELQVQLESSEFHTYAHQSRIEAPFYSEEDIKYRFLRNQARNTQSFEAVMSDLVERRGFDRGEAGRRVWMTDADLLALTKAGHYIGLHSYDHPYEMNKLTRTLQREQYQRNGAHIEAATGVRPECMSHPLNSYNDDSLQVLEELGVKCGFRANMVPPAGGGVNPTRLELAREDAANLLPLPEHARP